MGKSKNICWDYDSASFSDPGYEGHKTYYDLLSDKLNEQIETLVADLFKAKVANEDNLILLY